MTVNAQKIIDSAVDRCLRAGVRMTKKRRLILSCLLKQKKPLSAYGIIDAYHEVNKQVLSDLDCRGVEGMQFSVKQRGGLS